MNLIAAIASIILAGLAIWLSIVFFRSSTQAEKNTEIAINKIGDATDTLSRLSMRMIGRLTNALVTTRPVEERTEELFKQAKRGGLLKELEEDDNPTKARLEQFRVDNLILRGWLSNTVNGVQKIQDSPVKHMYENVVAVEDTIRSVREYYTIQDQPVVAVSSAG